MIGDYLLVGQATYEDDVQVSLYVYHWRLNGIINVVIYENPLVTRTHERVLVSYTNPLNGIATG